MSEARKAVLATIRQSLGVTGREAPRRSAVENRLAAAPRGIIPERGQLDRAGRVALFIDMARRAAASVTRVASKDDVPAEIADFLREHNLPASLRIGGDEVLSALPWSTTALDLLSGASRGEDANAVSRAFGGIAESGTLALVSGSDNPTTLNFLPDTHIVVLAADDICGDYETVFDRMRQAYGQGQMPRTLNFITGPSRSADIEQTLILGAHGPRRLHIVVVDP